MVNKISEVTRAMTEAALTANARIFAIYGKSAGTIFGGLFFALVSLGLIAGLSVGEKEVWFNVNLTALWIEQGSRSSNEYNFVSHQFGGNSRDSLVIVALADGHQSPTSSSDHGLLTLENLQLIKDLFTPLMSPYDSTAAVMTQNGMNFTVVDFCSRAPVNSQLLPWTPIVPNNYRHPYNVGTFLNTYPLSGAVGYLTQCFAATATATLNAYNYTTISSGDYVQLQMWYQVSGSSLQTTLNGDSTAKSTLAATRPGLPLGWGVAKMPCTRSTILDCWYDGSFDYPTELQELGNYAASFLALTDSAWASGVPNINMLTLLVNGFNVTLANSTSALNTWYTNCILQLESDAVTALVDAGESLGLAEATVATALPPLKAGIPSLLGLGYWWRPKLTDQDASTNPYIATSNPAGYYFHPTLAQNFFQSMQNAYSSSVTANLCVAGGLFRNFLGLTMKQVSIGGHNYNYFSPSVLEALQGVFVPDAPFLAVSYSENGFAGGCCYDYVDGALTPNLFLGTSIAPSDPTTTPTTNTFLYSTQLAATLFPAGSPVWQQRFLNERGSGVLSLGDYSTLLLNYDEIWINYLTPNFNQDPSSVLYGSELTVVWEVTRSPTDLFTQASEVESSLLVAGYIALVAFSCFNFIVFSCPCTGNDFVYSRSMLCLLGMLSIGASNLASFGFMGWIGLSLNPLNTMLVPFLGVGLGLADLFVLIHMYEKHGALQDDDVDVRISVTMADAGSSITVTNAANAVAFLIPAGTCNLPAIYMFAYHMAAAIVLNWFVVIFFIVPLVAWDARRVQKRKSYLLPCITADRPELDIEKETNKFTLHYIIANYVAVIYTNIFFKIFSLCLFLGGTAFLGWYGFDNLDTGLLLSDVALKGTPIEAYLAIEESNFPIFPGSFVIREIDFYDSAGNHILLPDFQENILTVLKDSTQSPYIDSINTPYSFNWVPNLIKYYKTNVNASATTVPSAAFYPTLRSYLASLSGGNDVANMVCKVVATGTLTNCTDVDGTNITVVASASTAFYNNIVTDADYVNAINNIRYVADNSAGQLDAQGNPISPTPMFFTGVLFLYWQQYVDIENIGLKAVGYSMLGVFGTIFIFQFNFLSALLVGCMLLATTVQLFGFMHVLNLKLNGFSMLNLACAVGLGVELSAYVSYSFLRMNAKSDDPNERMKLAVSEMFPPMFQGAMTGFISVIVLNFTHFPFFGDYYFKMISLMIWLAFANGIWFLPIILSIVNPIGLTLTARMKSIGSHGGKDDKFVDDGL